MLQGSKVTGTRIISIGLLLVAFHNSDQLPKQPLIQDLVGILLQALVNIRLFE